jgi:FkbM family methyltransferase
MLSRLVPPAHRQYLSWHRDSFGLWPALRAYPAFLRRGGRLVAVSTPQGGRVWLRPGTADLTVYDEVFRQQEYALPVAKADYIIDAGAHIGCASVWFAQRYPQARILSIEPEAGNFAILQRHAKDYPGITPIRAGVWSHSSTLQIANPTANTWSFRVAEGTGGETIPAVSIDELLAAHRFPRVDILKLDVEGAEVDVLKTADRWLDRVGTLIVELHDRFRPGCSAALERALGSRQVTITRTAESTIVTFATVN